ncbi:uncharacterized protein BO66DRAFT_405673 [Aspergillus aculeatinus CBS 121060]|uniref:Uncharacterized protein n=1 Tax=Aspergillus aculeatinus CBS 121060 TaxID=1448322 RepID=A0ACD1GVP0_9EURO|nr:hypothetical protein BO66DRAFT_405673 [Aspergillus aculeatinus CBS 121060]RAH65205.1 hypothetical protein BO66DRAFT_405673 [Aspergillus aculeatinus CBS 121060]
MSDYVEQTFAEVVGAPKGLKALHYVDYAHRLQNMARRMFQQHLSADRLQVYVDRAPADPAGGPNPDKSYTDIFIYDLFIRFSITAVLDGIASFDGKNDPQNLGRNVDKSNLHLRYLECTTNLLGSCILEHINRDLKFRGASTNYKLLKYSLLFFFLIHKGWSDGPLSDLGWGPIRRRN